MAKVHCLDEDAKQSEIDRRRDEILTEFRNLYKTTKNFQALKMNLVKGTNPSRPKVKPESQIVKEVKAKITDDQEFKRLKSVNGNHHILRMCAQRHGILQQLKDAGLIAKDCNDASEMREEIEFYNVCTLFNYDIDRRIKVDEMGDIMKAVRSSGIISAIPETALEVNDHEILKRRKRGCLYRPKDSVRTRESKKEMALNCLGALHSRSS